ncbi:MAG TPA: HAMP domain-containing protein, partial [Chloroflexi bacterium]|nr:HAMP domain-containing protein [Chloroflexota bacterium]
MLHSIRSRIAIPYAVLILLIVTALILYLSHLVRTTYIQQLENRLTKEAELLAETLPLEALEDGPGETLDALAGRYSQIIEGRVTIIASDGTVLGESHEDRTQMENHLYRPEVQGALARGQGSSVRFSRTLGYDMMYVAVPVSEDGRVVGFARLALSLQAVEATVAQLRWAILGAGLLAAAVAVGLAIILAERTARPIRALTTVAQRMAKGESGVRLFPTSRD